MTADGALPAPTRHAGRVARRSVIGTLVAGGAALLVLLGPARS